jgi:hypothetical protein
MASPSIMVSAHVVCYINNKMLGVVTGFSWTSNTPRKEIRSIDIPVPVELASTTTSVSFSMSVLRATGDGGMQGSGVVVPQNLVSREKYFTILLVDRATDLPVFKADFCQTDSESWTVTPKSLLSGQVQGKGLIWNNEASL